MNAIEQHYKNMLATKSDIQAHLPTLRQLVRVGWTVVEFGFRTGISTSAFLAGGADVISYDIDAKTCKPYAQHYFKIAKKHFGFIVGDSLKVTIQPCNLLFIDSLHTYAQLKAELFRHHDKVSDFIVMHDTETFGNKDKVGKGAGLMPAIGCFQKDYPEWMTMSHSTECNGLTILKLML